MNFLQYRTLSVFWQFYFKLTVTLIPAPGHPNVRAFVTHGGLMGTMEAAYSGVPMVGIPLFGDQFHNVRCYVSEGIAVNLNYHTLSKSTVLSSLKKVLENPR
jgi:glucuronosyltransferase